MISKAVAEKQVTRLLECLAGLCMAASIDKVSTAVPKGCHSPSRCLCPLFKERLLICQLKKSHQRAAACHAEKGKVV